MKTNFFIDLVQTHSKSQPPRLQIAQKEKNHHDFDVGILNYHKKKRKN